MIDQSRFFLHATVVWNVKDYKTIKYFIDQYFRLSNISNELTEKEV